MENKNNRNISETFGKYADNSGFGNSNGYNKVRQPQNVSSSMWEPISTGTPPEKKAAVPHTEKKKKPETQKTAQKTAQAPISGGRPETKAKKQSGSQGKKAPAKKAEDKKAPVKKAEDKKTPAKKKPSQKSRVPKGKPVTKEMMQEIAKKSEKAKDMRQQSQLRKSRADYDEQSRQGKSHNEISKKRAGEKKKKRRIRTVATMLLFFVFVAGIFCAYFYAKGAPVANIVVEGESIYKDENIISAADLEIGINMFTVTEGEVNKKVTAELPYIHRVDIKRKLPDTIIVTVEPTADKYHITGDKSYICLDENLKVVSVKKRKLTDGSFRILGLDSQEAEIASEFKPSENNKERFSLAQRIVSAIESKGIMKKAEINLEDLSDVTVTYDSRIVIYLGDCKELENRISLASDVVETAASQGQTGYIDTRYNGRAYFNEGTMKVD